MANKNDPDGPLHKWGEPEGVKDYKKKTPGEGEVKEMKLRTDVPQNKPPQMSDAAKKKLRRIAKPTDMSGMDKAIKVGSRMEENDLDENFEMEKREMAETQLHFVKYAAEEIIEYIDMGGVVEEWYQNKLSKVHSDMEGLHSWIEGEKRRTGMAEEVELDEGTKEMLAKYHKYKDKQMSPAEAQQFRQMVRKLKAAGVSLKEVEQIDELKKSTLASYIKKANRDGMGAARVHRSYDGNDHATKANQRTMSNRRKGIDRAVDRLSKEEVEQIDEASLRKRIAQRGRIETKLRAMKNDDADMAAFLINQDDQKELAKFLKSLDPKSRKAIESIMNEGYVSHAQRKAVWASRNDEKEKQKTRKEGTDFAAHRAAQAQAPTQADREKMRKVAALLAKERKVKKEEVGADKDGDGVNIPREREFKGKSMLPKHDPKYANLTPTQRYQNMMKKKMKKEEADLDEANYTMAGELARRAHEKQKRKDAADRLKAKGWVRNDRGGWSKPTKEEVELDEARKRKPSKTQIAKVMGPTKNIQQAYDAVMKKYDVDMTTAKTWVLDVYTDAIKSMKEEVELDEKLNPSMGAGEYVKDFRDSDAPQFKGKSMEKKQKMAIAAFLNARRKQQDEAYGCKSKKKVRKEEVELDEGMGQYTHYIIKDSSGKVKHHEVVGDESGNSEMEHRSYLRKSVMKSGDKLVSFDMNTKSKKDALKHKIAVSMKEEVDLEENAVHKIAAKYGFEKKKEKSPSTGKTTTGMVHPKTGERISSMGHMQQSFGHSRKDGSTVKTGSTADLHKHLQSKGYKMNEEAEQTDEARSPRAPSNYAAMMMKKRKKAGTSEFGRHPDKKLSPAQSKHMDTDKDGDIDATDLKNLRNKK